MNSNLLVIVAYWQAVANRRKFFVDIADDKGFDPMVADNWYALTLEEVIQHKVRKKKGGGLFSQHLYLREQNATLVLAYYNGSFENALVHLFPEVSLERGEFHEIQRWQDISNRRNLFLNVAKEEGFDPLIAANWYEINAPTIVNYKVFLFYYMFITHIVIF